MVYNQRNARQADRKENNEGRVVTVAPERFHLMNGSPGGRGGVGAMMKVGRYNDEHRATQGQEAL